MPDPPCADTWGRLESGERSFLDRCEACDSWIPAGAEWCVVCWTPAPRAAERREHPLSAAPLPSVVRAPSRRREGALTFGLKGRIAITVVVVVIGVAGMLFFLLPYRATGSSIALAYTSIFLGPYGAVAWLVLRDVWKRAWQPIEVLTSRPGPPPAGTPEEDA
jgi:hypothetical protein